MASIVINGDSSGSLTLSAPSVAGSNTQTLVATTGTLAPIVSGTVVASTSGTSIDFTSIPSWVKRITVMFSGVSTTGTSIPTVQLGDSGGIETSSYVGAYARTNAGSVSAGTLGTGGFYVIAGGWTAAATVSGSMVLTLLNSATNTWSATSTVGSSIGEISWCGGSKSLSDVLTQIRITTAAGTDTFDAGSINILYE